MSETKIGAVFTGQIYDIRTKKDGSGRIQIDFGVDAMDEIQFAQRIALARNCLFEIALVPIQPGVLNSPQQDGEYEVDSRTGEIKI